MLTNKAKMEVCWQLFKGKGCEHHTQCRSRICTIISISSVYSCLKHLLDKDKLMKWELRSQYFYSMSSNRLICSISSYHVMLILQNVMYCQCLQNLLCDHDVREYNGWGGGGWAGTVSLAQWGPGVKPQKTSAVLHSEQHKPARAYHGTSA